MSKIEKPVKAGISKTAVAARKAKFVESYIANGGNATQAAIGAGYAESDARNRGLRLSKDADISRQIASRVAIIAQQFELTTERTLREIARLSYSDPRRLYHSDGRLKAIHELDEDTAATVSIVEVDEIMVDGVVVGHTKKVKMWDKNAALEKAMKFHGLYKEDNKQRPMVHIIDLAGRNG